MDPDARFQTAQQMFAAIERLLPGGFALNEKMFVEVSTRTRSIPAPAFGVPSAAMRPPAPPSTRCPRCWRSTRKISADDDGGLRSLVAATSPSDERTATARRGAFRRRRRLGARRRCGGAAREPARPGSGDHRSRSIHDELTPPSAAEPPPAVIAAPGPAPATTAPATMPSSARKHPATVTPDRTAASSGGRTPIPPPSASGRRPAGANAEAGDRPSLSHERQPARPSDQVRLLSRRAPVGIRARAAALRPPHPGSRSCDPPSPANAERPGDPV